MLFDYIELTLVAVCRGVGQSFTKSEIVALDLGSVRPVKVLYELWFLKSQWSLGTGAGILNIWDV